MDQRILDMVKGPYMYAPLEYFILARHDIYLRKKMDLPKPWTNDEILQNYRFCNVYRELDVVTQWIANNWRTPHADNPEIWFWMVVARLVNWPETLQEMGLNPSGWYNGKKFLQVIHSRQAEGLKAYSGAYIVSTNGHTQDKAEYLVEHVLNPLWSARKKFNLTILNWRAGFLSSLSEYHKALVQCNGLGSFMAAQVVADLKYLPLLEKEAVDWWSWAASGPGSKRGLNRVLRRDPHSPWKEAEWWKALDNLRSIVNRDLRDHPLTDPMTNRKVYIKLHAQDLQNCLCEFDKYERVRLGQGKPRSRYQGTDIITR